jgi:hypothetical protein
MGRLVKQLGFDLIENPRPHVGAQAGQVIYDIFGVFNLEHARPASLPSTDV